MPANVITVENLSKRYILSHQSGKGGGFIRYERFSDLFVNAARKAFRRPPPAGNANASREEFWALKDLSFTVGQGDVLGIVGRNGAGKSTLLKVLSRIVEPTRGRIELEGRVASLLEVGTGFHPELTGRENIYLNGAVLGMTRREIRLKFDEIVAFAEVEKFLDTAVKHYSSGMYVRLAFAVAAHLDPEILIIDEVLAVGDGAFQKKCLGRMKDISGKEGRTVIFVSHHMGTVAALCTKGIYLKQGTIDFAGGSHAAIERYINDGNHDQGERVWPVEAEAPGSERLRLRAIRILSQGKTAAEVPINHEIQVEIEFTNLVDGTRVCPSIHLFDHLGVTVLCTANFPSASLAPDPWFDRPAPAGFYRTRCTLPANFLNEGKYRVSVFLHINVVEVEARADDAVAFTVQETGEMRREYAGPWTGVVRPKLAWETGPMETSLTQADPPATSLTPAGRGAGSS